MHVPINIKRLRSHQSHSVTPLHARRAWGEINSCPSQLLLQGVEISQDPNVSELSSWSCGIHPRQRGNNSSLRTMCGSLMRPPHMRVSPNWGKLETVETVLEHLRDCLRNGIWVAVNRCIMTHHTSGFNVNMSFMNHEAIIISFLVCQDFAIQYYF